MLMTHVMVKVPVGHTVEIHSPHPPAINAHPGGMMGPGTAGAMPGPMTGMVNDPMAAGAKAAMDAALPTPNDHPIAGRQPSAGDGKMTQPEQPARKKPDPTTKSKEKGEPTSKVKGKPAVSKKL
jgi:hypothetical protein